MPDTMQVIERDGDEIAAEVYAEMDAAEKGLDLTADNDSTRKKDESEEAQTVKESEEQAEGGEEDGDAAKEGNEEEADKKDAEGEEKAEGEEEKEVTEDRDKQITEYAEKHRMTYAEAKEDIEKTEGIIQQFKNDPVEMARALRGKDREYHKLKNQMESKEKKEALVFKRMTDDQYRAYAKDKVSEPMIQKYREKFPAKSEAMSDEAIKEEIIEHTLGDYHRLSDDKERDMRNEATKIRETLIQDIQEKDRRFIPEVKSIIYEMDDVSIIQGDNLLEDALLWAKGKAYDADIKAAEERAVKRMKENPEIMGKKPSAGSSKTSTPAKETGLTNAQKERAIEMFGEDNQDDEKCFKLFKETYEEELKKNPRFIG